MPLIYDILKILFDLVHIYLIVIGYQLIQSCLILDCMLFLYHHLLSHIVCHAALSSHNRAIISLILKRRGGYSFA